jgi:hypothetical protein
MFLYIPEASKNLAFVHRLTSNNHAFIEDDYWILSKNHISFVSDSNKETV